MPFYFVKKKKQLFLKPLDVLGTDDKKFSLATRKAEFSEFSEFSGPHWNFFCTSYGIISIREYKLLDDILYVVKAKIRKDTIQHKDKGVIE